MQFRTLALGTILTIATFIGTQSVTRAESPIQTVVPLSALQATPARALYLQITPITFSMAQSSSEYSSPQRQGATATKEAYASFIKEFTLTIRKDADQQPQNASSTNLYGFSGNPSFEGESTPEQSLGYRHLNFSGNLN
jgi:hypothetical protein